MWTIFAEILELLTHGFILCIHKNLYPPPAKENARSASFSKENIPCSTYAGISGWEMDPDAENGYKVAWTQQVSVKTFLIIDSKEKDGEVDMY